MPSCYQTRLETITITIPVIIIIIIIIFTSIVNLRLSAAQRLIAYRHRSVPCANMSPDGFALSKFLTLVKSQMVVSPLDCLTEVGRVKTPHEDDPFLAILVFRLASDDVTDFQCHLLDISLVPQENYAFDPSLRDATATPYCRFYALTLQDRLCHQTDNREAHFKVIISNLWPTHHTLLLCEPDWLNAHWTLIQRRLDGSENFSRPWEDYKRGFGHFQGEFWLGLENIRRLTSLRSSNTILFEMTKPNGGGTSLAYYDGFRVGGESDGYRVSVGTYAGGNAGDSFSAHDGAPFDTFDKLPRDPNACPEKYHGGFWYTGSSCHQVNPNGLYGSTDYKEGINWFSQTGYDRSLRVLEIKLRADY